MGPGSFQRKGICVILWETGIREGADGDNKGIS